MAVQGCGIWSLVALSLIRRALNSMLLWLSVSWRPGLEFSEQSFKEMFGFGSKLLVSSLMDASYRNIYLLVIGKVFSASELGYYTRADQVQALPSENMTSIIARVSYPILSSIQDDKALLKKAYQELIRSTMLVTFLLMLGLAAMSRPLVATVIGDQWLPAVEYLQMLCFVGMFYPLHALNLNMLQVKGRSDLFLRLEVIKKALAIPTIVIGIIFGIKIMIVGMMVNTLVAYYLNSYWSGRLIGYSIAEQLKDVFPSFLLAGFVGASLYLLGAYLNVSDIILLAIQCLVGCLLVFVICEASGFRDYLSMKRMVLETISGRSRL